MLEYQLAWLKVKQGCRSYLGSLIPPGVLLNSMLSLPNVVNPQFLEPFNNVANFGEISFFFVWSQLIGQGGQLWDGYAW